MTVSAAGESSCGGSSPTAPVPFGARSASVAANRAVGPYRFVEVDDPLGPDPYAGQFYMIGGLSAAPIRGTTTPGDEAVGRPYLPRPFSACSVAGPRRGFLVDTVGPGTAAFADTHPGETLRLSGPFGNDFPDPEPGCVPVLVSGGVGVPPVALMAAHLRQDRVEHRVVAGFRSTHHAQAASFLGADARVAVEAGADGTGFRAGRVTDLLLEELNDIDRPAVYACGPPGMLDAVKRILDERGLEGWIAMEATMACGFGACFGCVVPTVSGPVRLCVDGPVMSTSKILTVDRG